MLANENTRHHQPTTSQQPTNNQPTNQQPQPHTCRPTHQTFTPPHGPKRPRNDDDVKETSFVVVVVERGLTHLVEISAFGRLRMGRRRRRIFMQGKRYIFSVAAHTHTTQHTHTTHTHAQRHRQHRHSCAANQPTALAAATFARVCSGVGRVCQRRPGPGWLFPCRCRRGV
jgi:hypothetical protein